METALSTSISLRDWLVRAFESRLARNPSYSLRSYARDLKLDPSQLSAILKGKKGISPERAEQIAKALGLSTQETQRFILTVRQERSRSSKERNLAKTALQVLPDTEAQPFQTLSMDHYRTISDWYNTAILEYLRRPRVNQTPQVIAKQFQISVVQVEEALSRLERLQFIEKVGVRFRVTTGPIASPNGIPSEALRNHHSQTLKKAESALHFQSLDMRAFSSTQLLIRTEKIPEIKKFLEETRKIFCERYAANETGDGVYEFSYQLFELGKIETNKQPNTRGAKRNTKE